MKKSALVFIASIMALIVWNPTPLFSQTKLEPYIEIDLLRLEEAYRLIDRYGEKIWPGWKNNMEIEFRLQYPNLVFVIVGPRDAKVPEGYELVTGRTVRGKKIYVNRKDELPLKLQPPLLGGGKGGMTIRIMLQETGIKSEDVAKAIEEAKTRKDPRFQPSGDSEGQILLLVHEFFHGFQSKVMKRHEGGKRGRDFQVNPEYSTYSNIEGLALLDAYREKDKAKAFACFKDYSVAREIKRTFMPPDAAANEAEETVSEGTASYSDAKMAILIREKKYKPKMSSKDDPFFFNYKYVGGYAYEKTEESIGYILSNTLDTLGKCYTYGLIQCLLLDRFIPGWKNKFFESGRSLDEVTEKLLNVSAEDKKAIAEGFKAKYKYDELYAKHAAVIKDRDETMAIVNARVGKRYIIDFKKTKDFIIPQPRGRSVRVGVECFYVDGIEDFHLGDILLTTADTPFYQPTPPKNMFSLEWVDTEAKPGEKGYTFTFDKQEDDVYKNIEFKTPGFTLKAPEVQIVDDPDKNEVSIIIVRKVAK